jgi:uncharacterized protein YegL
MDNAFNFKVYYNPYISPTKNSVWGVVSVSANVRQEVSTMAAISLICDVSGSMQGAKFNKMVETAEHLLQNVPAGVLFSVVVFDNDAHEIVPQTQIKPNTDRANLVSLFRRNMKAVRMFGGTSMSTGINQALATQGSLPPEYVQYGIFLSDGNNTENEAQLVRAVQAAAKTNMHLCAYGYGSDWNPNELTKMAQITQGWMPKVVPSPDQLQDEFAALVSRMAKTVANDVVLNLWTPTGARILSLSQAYPDWVKGEAAPVGDDHTWVVPVPPMAENDHRDFVVHIELANVGRRVVACKPSVSYASGGQRIEEKGDQSSWIILEQTNDDALYNQVNPIVAGYLGQGELASETRSMTEALERGDAAGAERHRTAALDIAKSSGNRQMTAILEDAGKGSVVARKTVALGTSTVSLTDENEQK